jgi:hypothetical protein
MKSNLSNGRWTRIAPLLMIGLIAILISSVLLTSTTCTKKAAEEPEVVLPVLPKHLPIQDVKERHGVYAPVAMTYDKSILSGPEKAALDKLLNAAHIMDELFLRQVWDGNVALRDSIVTASQVREGATDAEKEVAAEAAELLNFFRINFGPWDRIDNDSPFINSLAKPAHANYYPNDMAKEEFEQFVAVHPEQEAAFTGYFTTIRRDEGGALKAVPYNVEYNTFLAEAAGELRAAADILTDPANTGSFSDGVDYATLAVYLRSRADAFLSNDYYQSDMDWMDVKDNIIDVTIGPYEVYEDGLFGYKAAFEAFIAVRNPADGEKLEGLKSYMQKLENNLPIPVEHKNPNRGSESPISVVDLAFTAGDTKAGVQTIAFNLPNDERVREAKGSKKVMLKNISMAKCEKILVPIAEMLLDPHQIEYVDFETYFYNTLMHEFAHGLGPGNIKLADGTETTVNKELKELYSFMEEAKADILGLYNTAYLVKEGFLPEGSDTRAYVTFLPGFFRAIRFGTHSAHGKANLMEFNYLKEKGGISFSETNGTFHVNLDKMPMAVEALAKELLMIQALGDYAAAKNFIDTYAVMAPKMESLLTKLETIPTDIEPIFEASRH